MSSGKALAIKRINKEMKEISNCPLEGIGIISIDNNPMKYIVNICIMSEIIKGYCVQLLLTFPDNYPINPPKILVFPGQNLESNYHHSIDNTKDENGQNFTKFCFDLFDNYYDSTSEVYSGWNPSFSISSLLIQLQNYIGDPEIFFNYDKNKLKELMKSMKLYKRKFIVKDGKGEIIKIHTWENPYPEIFFTKEDNKNKKEEINQKNNDESNKNLLKENLACYLSKFNYIDNQEIILGYSIIQKEDKYSKKYELFIIPELLTFESFMSQIGQTDSILTKYYISENKYLSNYKIYNYWIPIYLNENHYLKSKKTIINSFTIIKLGVRGIRKYYFKPEQFFDIFPVIINKIISGIKDDNISISSSFIRCFFHYALLFKKLIKEYEKDFSKYLNHILNLIHKNEYNITKSIIPDIKDILVLLFFCEKNTHTEKMKKMWFSLIKEYFIRQMFYIFHNIEEIKDNLINLEIDEEKDIIQNELNKQTDLLKVKIKKECLREGQCSILIDNNKTFIELIKKERIFNKIIDIIFPGIFDRKYLSEPIINKMNENFQEYFNDLSIDKKKRIYSLFEKNGHFNDCFNLSNFGELLYSNKFKNEYKSLCKAIEDKKRELFQINYIFTNYKKEKNKEIIEDFLNYTYERPKENNLLLILYFIKKKMNEKDFMLKLEKNCGVYLDVNKFIKEMKQKLNEIKSYKQLFEYIESEFGKNENEIELIKKAYEKVELKGHFNNNSNENNLFSKSEEINRESDRGRGLEGEREIGRENGRRARGRRGRGRGRGRRS